MSYGPFLGGKRICLGKTFVETASKFIGPTLISHFDFEFVDKKHMNEKPSNNLVILHEPSVMVHVKEHNL